MTQQATNQILKNPNRQLITAKRRATTRTNVVSSKKRETKMSPTEIVPVTIIVIVTVVKQTLIPTITKLSLMVMPRVQQTEMTENQELSTHPMRRVAKRSTPRRIVILEPMQQTDSLLAIDDRWNKIKFNSNTHKSKQFKVFRLRPKL